MESGGSSEVVLYSYFRSTCSWRVRIALAIKGIDYTYEAVHLLKDGGKQHSEDYKKLNPGEKVPALKIDGYVLSESLPICEYLEETRPENPLFPKDPYLKFKCRQLCEVFNSGTQPI